MAMATPWCAAALPVRRLIPVAGGAAPTCLARLARPIPPAVRWSATQWLRWGRTRRRIDCARLWRRIDRNQCCRPSVTTTGGPVVQATGTCAIRTGSLPLGASRLRLTAYQNGQALAGFSFLRPLDMTLRYTDQEVVGLQENTLALFLLDGSSWQAAAGTCPLPSTWVDPATNRLQLQLCHLTTFGLLGRLSGADLTLSLTVNPGMAFPGQSLTYTISYANDGPQAAPAS